MMGPMLEADPASARPNPSKIVFLPTAITFSGMSSYFTFTINSETYLVSPGAAGKSPVAAANADDSDKCQPLTAAAVATSEFLKKSRRIMGISPPEMSRQQSRGSALVAREFQASPL